MSHAERKARKRAGTPFHREPKVGTPLEDRVLPMVQREGGAITVSNRAMRRIEARIELRDGVAA